MPRARKEKLKSPLAMRHGVSASRVWLPKNINNEWNTILDFLESRFPFIGRKILEERMLKDDIVSETGKAFKPLDVYQGEIFLFYYREIPNESKIPFKEKILFKNENFIVVDKPHFIPVTPTGRYVKECLLARLKHFYQNEDISPIHRLDRETAGIILFTCNKDIRGAYQTLFQKRQVTKQYEAIAAKIDLNFPVVHKSRLEKGNPFFIMQEVEGEINAETTVYLQKSKGALSKYILKPITGKQHQLRVHMMSLGMPILHDPFYPEVLPSKGEDYRYPLQLLAKSIEFIDPISEEIRFFESQQSLLLP